MTDMRRVLIIDDDREMREALLALLTRAGWEADTLGDPRRALDQIAKTNPDVILSDLQMPGMSGDDVLRALPDDAPPFVMITAHGDVPTAVEMMQGGAYSFVEKPFDPKRLLNILRNAAEQHQLRQGTARLKARLRDVSGLNRVLLGDTPAITALRDEVLDLADVAAPVLIRGATGTGKEVIARALHDLGPNNDAPFLAINCATLTEAGFAADLFGHADGPDGLIAAAGRGTLFLDEIAAAPIVVQAGLLRVLETGEYHPQGAAKLRKLNARVLSASHADLEAAVQDGTFRADLFYRLNVVTLTLPPLAARSADIALLYHHFVARAGRTYGTAVPDPGTDDLAALLAHGWPGNVRELAHVADRIGLAARRGVPLGIAAAIDGTDPAVVPDTLREAVAALEREMIARAIREQAGRMDDVAAKLGIGRRTLNEKIVKLGLDKDRLL